jgi:glycosyltransferase involved in cell wall biosynthesis
VQAIVDHGPPFCPDLDFLFLKHPEGPERLSACENVREVVVPYEANGPATLLGFPAIVDLAQIDLYFNTFNILPYWLRIPSVVIVTDVMWIKHPDWAKGPGWWGNVEVKFYQAGMWHALRHASHVSTISEASRDEIVSICPEAAPRISVALEGVADDFHPLAEPERTRMLDGVRRRLLGGARRYVLTVGQYSVYKNHETVLRAFARAFRDEPDVHLGFVQRLGKGPAALRPIARQLGVDARVHFLHGVSLGDLVTLYNGALAYCHPSLYEGFGNGPAEAMACGCPVVTSNRSSMPEVSGVAALLVEPESVDEVAAALRRVADDPQLAQSMRERGLGRAAELSWQRYGEANVAMCRQVLGLPSR